MFGRFKKQAQNISPRDTLFGDQPLHYWANIDSDEEPWTLFKEAKKKVDQSKYGDAIRILKAITTQPGFESRHYLQACYFLTKLSSAPDFDLRIYGAVAEVGMDSGTDLVAIYADHSARYYNYTGKSIFWDQRDPVMSDRIDEILLRASPVVSSLHPWREARPSVPSVGMARINFLTSHGLFFREGSQQMLFNDPRVGRIMYGMLGVM